jgi:pyruvate-formate lyase-activating enzyme
MKFLRIEKAVTREDVVWCYRTLLRREPESEDAILSHLKITDFRSLVASFVTSPEYSVKRRAKHLSENAVQPSDTPYVSPEHNTALAMAEFHAGVLKVNSTPQTLTLETSSRCNLRCVMCPHSINGVQRPKHMDEELIVHIERFVRQAASIQLHGIGEPLASPAFWGSLKHIPQTCDSSINTNLTVLDERRLNGLIASTLWTINVSLDAARPETYQKIRGFSFDEVTQNLRRFVAARKASGKKSPLLHMNMTLMRSNIEEVLEFIDLAVDIGADAVEMWHLNWMPDAQMNAFKQERDGWTFDYAAEGLWNFPALSNEYLHKAEAHARARNIPLILDRNKILFYDNAGAPSAVAKTL